MKFRRNQDFIVTPWYRVGMDSYDAIVIGSGHNGLAAAALLADAGLRVAVLERHERLGGATVSERDLWPGYTISAASYVCSLLDPWLIERLELRAHGYDAYRKEPASFTPLLDGRSLLLGSDPSSNAVEISRFDPGDVVGFERFESAACELGAALFATFADERPNFASIAEPLRATLAGSAAALVERYVRTPVLQATLATDGLIGTYRGPFDAGTAYVLAHHYAGRAFGVQGAWGFVRGGMGAIADALASAARARGAEFFAGTPVAELLVEGGRVVGVTDLAGREWRAAAVLSNAHPVTTYRDLLGERYLDNVMREKLAAWESVGPSLKLNLALGELPDFTARPGRTLQPHHRATIHLAPDLAYLQRAHDEARTFGESSEPMLECFMQTPTDPSLAPAGKHILSIFAQYFPYDRIDGWSAQRRTEAADKIIAQLARYAPNLPAAIEARQVLAAPEIEERFGLRGGHIFHGELLPEQIFERRFDVRGALPGLYLCGSGTHPGGCVSGFPGRRAAAALLADVASPLAARSAG
ncbi:MAG TPA: NAD(P)/FAD-dependent oxidoreductase [Candidatus Dormibacteraeota bacterium]|nr:NAD(P)/FAD-dependent oxidoreductase [Candidatus Dormibacteraeota bacterium]